MNQQGLFRVDVDSFQKLIDGLDVRSRDELIGRLQEGAQQRYLDACKEFEPWEQEDFIHLSKIAPPNFFVDIIASYKSRSKLIPPTEDTLHVHTELRTKSIVQVADPPEEITEWVTDSSKSSFEYMATDYLYSQYIGAERWKKRSAPTFDVLSCNLKYAANLASLSYILGHKIRGSGNPSDQADTLLSTTVLPIILRSLKNTLAVEPKQSTLIPAPLSQLTTFSIKIFQTKTPPRRCGIRHCPENPDSLHEGAEVINRLLAISLEISYIEMVPEMVGRKIDRGCGVRCYQLVWAAGDGRKLLICDKTESEQLNG
ncbi:hypothetical protein BTUL_0014g00670 [Botrytis tulipae]|uniref:Uncharacterized protein n=1 Tax=Botrytis tulipae TaxID=87230 RepID=A0A4Z1F4N0_9HELO|nr:hypothetical protein BTUL_0014g00670 [Botrytis tulipae]